MPVAADEKNPTDQNSFRQQIFLIQGHTGGSRSEWDNVEERRYINGQRPPRIARIAQSLHRQVG